MLAVQLRLPMARARARCVRRAFHPLPVPGPYRLPRDVQDRFTSSLAPLRNREAAFALAAFLARFWSTPGRITTAFPIDRRALATHTELGLTEAQVRGAIRALEEVEFLDRVEPEPGKRYQRTEDGLHRRAMLYRFGSDYLPDFLAANKRAAAVRDRRPTKPRLRQSSPPSRPLADFPESGRAKSPKHISEAKSQVIMGELVKPPSAPASDPKVEAALERWRLALRQDGRGSGA